VLSITESSVRSRLFRARRDLAEKLRKEGLKP
jgi:DNA-directed RNA polymerase specialized sigma24 family protein